MTHAESLQAAFKNTLKLPDDVTEWLLNLWHVIQMFDDVIDCDKEVTRQDADRAIMAALLGMPSSPFWLRHHNVLMPVMLLALSKWQASDRQERTGNVSATSFVWRASYYDVVVIVCHIVHGSNFNPVDVMQIYGESFDEYKKEFQHA